MRQCFLVTILLWVGCGDTPLPGFEPQRGTVDAAVTDVDSSGADTIVADSAPDAATDTARDLSTDLPQEAGSDTIAGANVLRAFGGSVGDRLHDIVVDPSGDIFVAGSFGGTLTVDVVAPSGLVPTSLQATGNTDVFVARMNAQAKVLWIVQGHASVRGTGTSIDLAAGGDVYVAGKYTTINGMLFGTPLVAYGTNDGFVAKLDRDTGALGWVLGVGGANNDVVHGLAVTPSDGAVIVGEFRGTGTFGSEVRNAADGTDLFIASVSQAGSVDWAIAAGGDFVDIAHSVAVSNSGSIWVAGQYSDTLNLQGVCGSLQGDPGTTAFLAHLDDQGQCQWVRIGTRTDPWTPQNNIGFAVAIDNASNAYVAGQFGGTLNYGNQAITSNGGWDAFVIKYDASGSVVWANSLGGADNDLALGLGTDAAGEIYVTGSFRTEMQIGTSLAQALGNSDDPDGFVATVDQTSKQLVPLGLIGGPATEMGRAFAAGPNYTLYLTGTFSSPIANFGTANLSTAGQVDGFVWQLR